MAYFLALAGLIIGISHLLPRPRPGRLFRAGLIVITGFLATQGVLSCAISALGLVPRGPLHELLEYLTEYDDDRPVVLLVGSSFTQQGIDPEVLAEILGESGRRITVLPLAIGGLSHLERLYYLKEYLAHAKRMPQLVLFEIAGGYDNGPLFQLQQMSFSDRMVAMMDGSSAWWAFRWLFSMDGSGLPTRIVLAGKILAHLSLHVGHIGFLWNSTRAHHPSGYDPRALPPKVQHFRRRSGALRRAGSRDAGSAGGLASKRADQLDARVPSGRDVDLASTRRRPICFLLGPKYAGGQCCLCPSVLRGYGQLRLHRR
jgi:hypothetical protein